MEREIGSPRLHFRHPPFCLLQLAVTREDWPPETLPDIPPEWDQTGWRDGIPGMPIFDLSITSLLIELEVEGEGYLMPL